MRPMNFARGAVDIVVQLLCGVELPHARLQCHNLVFIVDLSLTRREVLEVKVAQAIVLLFYQL